MYIKKNWLDFYDEMKLEILKVDGDTNLPYLITIQEHSKKLVEWIIKTNINVYNDFIDKYSINKLNDIDVFLYQFYFDWSDIEEEMFYKLK